ncbi:MAG TPA: AMP-binding protein, partial [Thermoguttaceae bacterium]|nr:AMP-binding protein [Thermoguttaceae bacterium]
DCGAKALRRIVETTAMRRILVSSRFHATVQPIAEPLGIEIEVERPNETDSQDLYEPDSLPPIVPEQDPAAIMFTSGSTGEPKGVVVTHRNIECNTRDIVDYLRLSAEDRMMVVLPFHYCYGASLLHTHLMAGGSLVLNNRFMFPEKVLDEIQSRRCTGFAGVPSTYQILLRKTRFRQRTFPTLNCLQQAGGKLPDTLIREIRNAMPDARLVIMYGQTEATARLSYLPPDRLDEKLGSIGTGLPGTRLEVLRSDGTPVRPGSDEVGEIVASGDNIASGYFGDEEETQRFFRDRKLYTGDMARVDKDGYLYIVERARDFIKSLGNRVSPKEIEEIIAQIPEVVEVAVVGRPHEVFGEALKAFVVATSSDRLTAEQIRTHCLKQLPNYKIPEQIEFLARLPKTAAGKVAKERLKQATSENTP